MSPFPCCCVCNAEQPKLEIVELGYMCCCVRIKPCCGEPRKVVLMPFEDFPFPCCCYSNRVSKCDNCCGLCGPVHGNPKIYDSFSPQPADHEAFVRAVNACQFGGGPEVLEMVR